jgi:hypothetical protein
VSTYDIRFLFAFNRTVSIRCNWPPKSFVWTVVMGCSRHASQKWPEQL